MYKSSWRKCVFGCDDSNTMYSLPKDEATREKWLDFIYGNPKQENYTKNLFVCDRHFEDDCLMNKAMFESGAVSRLILQPGSVPTIYVTVPAKPSTSLGDLEEEEEKPSVSSLDFTQPFGQKLTVYQLTDSSLQPSPSTFPLMLLPGKTSEPKITKTVATQLSLNTLRPNHFRSKAVQSPHVLMSDAGVQTVKRQKGGAPLPEMLEKPRKRPRLEMEGEGEEVAFQLKAPVMDVCDLTHSDSGLDYEDTKYIVFERNLRELFDKCPMCGGECDVQRQKCGTFVSFRQQCPECTYSRKWQNQPLMKSTPVGDLQLSAAVYFSGASFQKTQRICKAMNLQIHQLDTFRRHSRMFLEPAISHQWRQHQGRLSDELKERPEVALGCDMKVCPPGQSAKMGSYTTMDLETKRILDIQLVQSKEMGTKAQMEKKGLKRCLNRLEDSGVKVDYFVTNHHNHVQKYLQNKQIAHFYDVWRLEQDLSKKLDRWSEQKDFSVIKKWSPAIKHHMYWTAASSKTGAEKVAKWSSFVNHIQDVHNHDDPLFPKCTHPERVSRDPDKWFKPGTEELYRVEKLLLNKRVLQDVEKICSDHQTSSLEVFHITSLQFTQKNENESFSFMEMMCRLFLAAMHYNENVAHEQATCWDAFLLTRSKQDCPTENTVRTKTTYGYVQDLMRLVFAEIFTNPAPYMEDLKTAQVPRKHSYPVDHITE